MREQERQRLLNSLKKNDHVLTSGGIYGTVQAVKDNEVTLKIDEASNVKIRVARSCIVGVVNEDASSGAEDVAKQAEQSKV
jgi:preprotein translocase subunit YajC